MMKSQNMVMKLISPSPATMLMTVSFKLNFPENWEVNKLLKLVSTGHLRGHHHVATTQCFVARFSQCSNIY